MLKNVFQHLLSLQKASWALCWLSVLLVAPLALAFQYQPALPGYTYYFPKDHASHEAYKTEWWYYTGHLKNPAGKPYGYELTFFRIGNDSSIRRNDKNPWTPNNMYAAHFALSDEGKKAFHFSEKLNRAGLNQAGARSNVYWVWNELWLAQQLGNQMLLRAQSPDGKQEIQLLLTNEKPPLIHGKNGISQKASCKGCASHYYSLTRLKTEGLLTIDGQVVPVQGLSWMDHEFGSNQLSADQTGWDWFSLQLSDKSEIMLYLLRHANGSIDANSSGTVVYPDGTSRHLSLKDFQVRETGKKWTSLASKGTYPMGWTITIPSEKAKLSVAPAFENQELFTKGSTQVAYWEGSSRVSGTRQGRTVQGQAYVEMTGYAPQSVKGKL